MDRAERTKIAHETLAIVDDGQYVAANDEIVNIAQQIEACRAKTQCFTPPQLDELYNTALQSMPPFANTSIEIQNETALAGAFRLHALKRFDKVCVLNFASAKNPGGGFLNGSQAQEESLARSSALYASLTQCPEYYHVHRQHRSGFYSDHMIYSPGCPIVRTDAGDLLNQPVLVDFITSAAPNARSIPRRDRHKIETVFRQRMAKMLALAAANRCRALVLGAWGCGVFRNDPHMVARLFAENLLPGQPFHGRFTHVLFAVLDTSSDLGILTPFQRGLQ